MDSISSVRYATSIFREKDFHLINRENELQSCHSCHDLCHKEHHLHVMKSLYILSACALFL